MTSKKLFIAEKPSVAAEFAKAMDEKLTRHDGFMEGDHTIVTWCFGHLVTMSLPDSYDEKYKKWRLETLPFLPEKYKYEIIKSGGKQFKTVKELLNREDVATIYVCTDSGREGEYIYRLVRQMAKVHDKDERRVWINSQTMEEIKRGIDEAKPLSAYDNLSSAAYLRAKSDYLMGMNFSRLLSIKYGRTCASFLGTKYVSIAVGRVMTCVLGMVVKREREIRRFVKTNFYRVVVAVSDGRDLEPDKDIEDLPACEWRAVEGSDYYNSPLLYKENGFKEEQDAQKLLDRLKDKPAVVDSISRKQEKKNAPLLYNLAELQNDCSKLFKIAPDQTLAIVQDLYEKKLVTYPRTDARVLSSAIAKEIIKNIRGLAGLTDLKPFVSQIEESGSYKNITKTKYVDDSKITDHYAIIPTGAGLSALRNIDKTTKGVYEIIARRFLAIFLPQAVYKKASLVIDIDGEKLFCSDKFLVTPGYLDVMNYSFTKNKPQATSSSLDTFKKGSKVDIADISIKTGETSPPKRYTTGSIILAMENAGNLIEDESLREEIKGSGIGTSATRAEILDKLLKDDYLSKNNKTQVLTPTLLGEMIYYVVGLSIRSMLNPELTAGWERGLSMVSEGTVTEDEYKEKMEDYIKKWVSKVSSMYNENELLKYFNYAKPYHEGEKNKSSSKRGKTTKRRGKK